MEDVTSGLLLPQSADGGGRVVVGTTPAYSTDPDCLHFHLSLTVQHSTSVPLPSRRKQGGQRGYGCVCLLLVTREMDFVTAFHVIRQCSVT